MFRFEDISTFQFMSMFSLLFSPHHQSITLSMVHASSILSFVNSLSGKRFLEFWPLSGLWKFQLCSSANVCDCFQSIWWHSSWHDSLLQRLAGNDQNALRWGDYSRRLHGEYSFSFQMLAFRNNQPRKKWTTTLNTAIVSLQLPRRSWRWTSQRHRKFQGLRFRREKNDAIMLYNSIRWNVISNCLGWLSWKTDSSRLLSTSSTNSMRKIF